MMNTHWERGVDATPTPHPTSPFELLLWLSVLASLPRLRLGIHYWVWMTNFTFKWEYEFCLHLRIVRVRSFYSLTGQYHLTSNRFPIIIEMTLFFKAPQACKELKRSRQAIFWDFYSPMPHCHSTCSMMLYTINAMPLRNWTR